MGQWSNLPVIITLRNSNFVVVRQALFNKVAAQMPVFLKDTYLVGMQHFPET